MALRELGEAVIRGDRLAAGELTEAALAEGLSPATIMDEGLIAAMGVVGERDGARKAAELVGS